MAEASGWPNSRFVGNQLLLQRGQWSSKMSTRRTTDWIEWIERPNFAASGPDDRHFQLLDAVSGEVRFGPADRLRGSRGVFDSEIASGFGSSHRERR